MTKMNARIVYQDTDGRWANKRVDASRAASKHDTQAEAVQAARRQLQRVGGGELTTKGQDGKIRSKDTIPPGRDLYPPKG